MQQNAPKRSPLAEVEREVLAEGQEWMRQRLEHKLAELARKQGKLSPPKRPGDHPGAPVQDSPAHVRRVD